MKWGTFIELDMMRNFDILNTFPNTLHDQCFTSRFVRVSGFAAAARIHIAKVTGKKISEVNPGVRLRL